MAISVIIGCLTIYLVSLILSGTSIGEVASIWLQMIYFYVAYLFGLALAGLVVKRCALSVRIASFITSAVLCGAYDALVAIVQTGLNLRTS
jgi:hypothetical protein